MQDYNEALAEYHAMKKRIEAMEAERATSLGKLVITAVKKNVRFQHQLAEMLRSLRLSRAERQLLVDLIPLGRSQTSSTLDHDGSIDLGDDHHGLNAGARAEGS